MKRNYQIELTDAELALLMFSLGNTSGMFYDGTHRHDARDNATFRVLVGLANKFAEAKRKQPFQLPAPAGASS